MRDRAPFSRLSVASDAKTEDRNPGLSAVPSCWLSVSKTEHVLQPVFCNTLLNAEQGQEHRNIPRCKYTQAAMSHIRPDLFAFIPPQNIDQVLLKVDL